MSLEAPEIKICGITNGSDRDKAVSLGASYLGYILYHKSPRSICLKNAIELMDGAVNQTARMVAVEVSPTPEYLLEIKNAGFDFFQIHFTATTELDLILKWGQIVGSENLWLAPKILPDSHFPEELIPFANTFLIDAFSEDHFGGTGKESDWDEYLRLKKKFPQKKWFLAGGLGSENLSDALRITKPDGVDLNSALESSPGVKNHEKLEQVFEILESIA